MSSRAAVEMGLSVAGVSTPSWEGRGQEPGLTHLPTPTAILPVAPALPCFSASVSSEWSSLTLRAGALLVDQLQKSEDRSVGRSVRAAGEKLPEGSGQLGVVNHGRLCRNPPSSFPLFIHQCMETFFWKLPRSLSLCKSTNSFLGVGRQACLL